MKSSILTRFLFVLLLLPLVAFVSCDDDVPEAEDEEEIITDVKLIFTSGSTVIEATAQDPDGEGPEDLVVSDAITLMADTEYVLTLELENAIEGESIAEEVEKESGEHMFFFSFSDELFANPTGDGNVDNRADSVLYNDQDGNGQPLGLSTTWTTGSAAQGSFRIILKHQPDIKTATSTVTDGSSDLDLTWQVNIQ
ncbi:MAG: hypothetical protein ACI8QD_000611 [Cyclobacteriaceae bacterium]|jgi:hypothetical protein